MLGCLAAVAKVTGGALDENSLKPNLSAFDNSTAIMPTDAVSILTGELLDGFPRAI